MTDPAADVLTMADASGTIVQKNRQATGIWLPAVLMNNSRWLHYRFSAGRMEMNKTEKYEELIVEVIEFDSEDVIDTSGDVYTDWVP